MGAEMAVVVAASIIFPLMASVSRRLKFTYGFLGLLTTVVAFVYAARNNLPALAYMEVGLGLWTLIVMIFATIGWIGSAEAPPEEPI